MRERDARAADVDLGKAIVATHELSGHAIGVAHEARDEGVAGAFVQVARRAFLRDGAVVHHDDAIGHRHGFRLVVRDVHDRQPEPLLQVTDLLAHLAAQARVEVGQRLVEQEHRRLEHERARKRHALLLPARELGGQARIEVAQADACKGLLRPRDGVLLATPATSRP
jgi:hypothetical protein